MCCVEECETAGARHSGTRRWTQTEKGRTNHDQIFVHITCSCHCDFLNVTKSRLVSTRGLTEASSVFHSLSCKVSKEAAPGFKPILLLSKLCFFFPPHIMARTIIGYNTTHVHYATLR